ncbi:DUF4012 domain-containing protein [Arthrobacter sp. Sa2CUA1]|uniref:DUF4012 domain-containing protein n=1 Tax=Arthrobacter gallicola TaxID=2762225 RepID=A0ABR8UU67_9MICC|nr:DUF4012 domain-containing protein [Arthrobacter gallicola]MBD7996073.1 DUF4012 domain-containing protein [Arthrobacter gallicola]
MSHSISSAKKTATGPLWKMGTFVPFFGPNLHAVTEVTVSMDDVAVHAGSPLLNKFDAFNWDSLSPTDGRIDTSALKDAEPVITAAANAVLLSADRMAAINLQGLLPAVSDPVASATTQLRELSTGLDMASAAARLLPEMLGDESPRKYLILVQNNAESRATGGIPGALAVLNVTKGTIELGEQTSASALGEFIPRIAVDQEQEDLFTTRIGRQMQNVNLTPHFPTAAFSAKQMWETRYPDDLIDGVVALDPMVLSYMLTAIGAVELSDSHLDDVLYRTNLPVSLNSDNVVSTLLSDVYRELEDNNAQDAYFAAVASEVFRSFTQGHGDATHLVNALVHSTSEQRLFLWSSRVQEQEIISRTALAGSVTGARAGGAAFGVYFNDGTGAKMDYYTRRTVQLLKSCRADGLGRYTVQVSIDNGAPKDAADSLPEYVTGGGIFGVKPGNIRTNYVLYGPEQSLVEGLTVNGRPVSFGSGLHGQRPVATVTIELQPGESTDLNVTFFKVSQDSVAQITVTPTAVPLSEVLLQSVDEAPCS